MEIVKQLVALEDLLLGTGTAQQERGGNVYTVSRIDLAPSVSSVAQLNTLSPAWSKAKIGHVSYKRSSNGWEIDKIPLEAIATLGTAASRNASGAGDLMAVGYAGVGGPALSSIAGLAVGLSAAYVITEADGAPTNEPYAVLTLPGAVANAGQLAIGATNGRMFARAVGGTWREVLLAGGNAEFNSIKANSVRANSVGTPKD